MGTFLTNITVRGPEQGDVLRELKALKRSAIVSPTESGNTVVFDEKSDEQSDELVRLTEQLSARLKCPALAALVHDSDVLLLSLYESGRCVMDYNSAPGYFEGGEEGPAGGDGAALCRAFGSKNAAAAQAALDEAERYVFAEERLGAVADALGLPNVVAQYGFGYLQMVASGEEDDPNLDVAGLARTP